MLRDFHIWKPLRLRLEYRIPARKGGKKKQQGRNWKALPSIGFDVVDSKGRRGVFLSIHYDGAKSTGRGVFRRRIEYGLNSLDVVMASDGHPMLVSNVARDPDEAVAVADEIEAFARAERLNGKVCYNLVIGYPRAAGARQRELILRRFCQRGFGDEGLPYIALNHEPKRRGEVHNPHGHITASLRPVHREGPYRYLISKDLRVDLDGDEGMARMRRILAEVTTQVMREAGFEHDYTHLSNAARGIALIPQEGLTKEQSEAAKRGEDVAANERNRVLARKARSYILEQIKKTLEAPKAPSLAKLPWAIARVPRVARMGLRAIAPAPLSELLGLSNRGKFVQVTLAKTAPARTHFQRVDCLKEPKSLALPLNRDNKAFAPLASSLSRSPVDGVQTLDRSSSAKAIPLTRLKIVPTAASPHLNVPQSALTTLLVKRLVQERPLQLVPALTLRPASRPMITPLARLTQTSDTAFLRAGRMVPAPIQLLAKANAGVAQPVPMLTRYQPRELLVPASNLALTKVVPAPSFVTICELQQPLPKLSRASLVHGIGPTPAHAPITGPLPVGIGKPPLIKWSERADAAHLIVAAEQVLPSNLTSVPLSKPSVPLIRPPARNSVRALIPITRFNKAEALRPRVAASRGAKLLPEAIRPARKVTLVPLVMLIRPATGYVRMARLASRIPHWLVIKSRRVEPPPRPSASEFDWLRAKVNAMHRDVVRSQLEPGHLSREKEKSDQRAERASPPADPATTQLDQLCWAFLYAKSDKDRRIAAVQIRKYKAAIELMDRSNDRLWAAEQLRFRTQQAGLGRNGPWGR